MLENNIKLSTKFPSSHFSFPVTMLSPQIVEHTLDSPSQLKPDSIKQVDEQPSSIKLCW